MAHLLHAVDRRLTDRTLRRLQLATTLLAAAGVFLWAAHASDVATSRRAAAVDSCQLFRGLVLEATPKSKLPDAEGYIQRTSLHDCNAYARKLVP